MRHSPLARLSAVAAAMLLSTGLAACTTGDNEDPDATTSPTAPVTGAPETESREPAASSTRETEETSASATSSPGDDRMPADVTEAYELFGTLAPASLFEQFDSCNPSGIDNAYECSGTEVGQFQFFDSMAKAASTTQLLTELRSSRVVEDTGSRVVGWSTLGTTAVITVVDNDQGLVMQQMISADRVDPEETIYGLDLAERPAPTSAETTTPTTQRSS